jgi:hypothetical protein
LFMLAGQCQIVLNLFLLSNSNEANTLTRDTIPKLNRHAII